MSLRAQALADVGSILENTTDWAQPITLIAPDGSTTAMNGLTGDISRQIEPDSGAIVKGRTIRVTLRIESLPVGARPEATNDSAANPWRVSFPRITSAVVTEYAVVATDPDDSMGSIVLELGDYESL